VAYATWPMGPLMMTPKLLAEYIPLLYSIVNFVVELAFGFFNKQTSQKHFIFAYSLLGFFLKKCKRTLLNRKQQQNCVH
jgi:hypothetical protein